jgi:hypothetical protein
MAKFLGLCSDMSYKTVIYEGDKMANKADLMERNGRWYFSKAYPKDLWPITGASPFRKSLGTDSLAAAIRARPDAERLYFSKVDAARATLEGRNPRKMTEVEAMGLVAKWFTAEDAERTAALEASQSPLMDIDGALSDLDALDAEARQAVAEADVHGVRPLALQLIAEAGLEADDKSREFKAFMAALLRGRRELLVLERQRVLGDYAVRPSDPLIAKALAEGMAVVPVKVRTVADMVDGYVTDNTPKWAPSTRKAADAPLGVLKEFLGADRDVTTLTRDDGRAIHEIVKGLPVNFRKRKELKGLPLPDAVAKGRELGLPTLAPKTVNEIYMTFIGGAIEWAAKERWIDANIVASLPPVVDPVAAVDKRSPFKPDQLNRLFHLGPWADPAKGKKGDPLRYWGPLLALYQGMRRGEIAQLLVTDNEMQGDIPVIHVRPTVDGQRVKSAAGRRMLPVHPELIRMGFLQFVAAQRKARHSQLFPNETPNRNGAWGDPLSKWFKRLLADNGITGTKLGMHSFRHNFEDALRAANLSQTPIGQELAGRAKADKVSGDYGSGRYSAETLKPAVEAIRYPAVDLQHLYVT